LSTPHHPHEELSSYLDPLPLGDWRYHPVVRSTNDLALAWAGEGAPDWSLVLADEQTTGRGRKSRRWEMVLGKGLAMSLILHPTPEEKGIIMRFTALAALGLIKALEKHDLKGAIKWPNDVLLMGKKLGGVLVDMAWVGESIKACVLGMGVNVARGSVPDDAQLRMPATSIEDACGHPVDRWEFLAQILCAMMDLRTSITEESFMKAWSQNLAFRDEWVKFNFPAGEVEMVILLGIDRDGKLILKHEDGRVEAVNSGEIIVENKKS
jgi:BirA family biotin operon repressor/biotin-[acetyl-CoA-carboxylase] ligase